MITSERSQDGMESVDQTRAEKVNQREYVPQPQRGHVSAGVLAGAGYMPYPSAEDRAKQVALETRTRALDFAIRFVNGAFGAPAVVKIANLFEAYLNGSAVDASCEDIERAIRSSGWKG